MILRRLLAGLSDCFDFNDQGRLHQRLNYRTLAEEHFVL